MLCIAFAVSFHVCQLTNQLAGIKIFFGGWKRETVHQTFIILLAGLHCKTKPLYSLCEEKRGWKHMFDTIRVYK